MNKKSLFDLLVEDLDQQIELGGGSKPPVGYGDAFIDPRKGQMKESFTTTVAESDPVIKQICYQAAERLGIDDIDSAMITNQKSDIDFRVEHGSGYFDVQSIGDGNKVRIIVQNSATFDLPVQDTLNEGADMEAIEYMDGMVDISSIEEFIGAARNIIRDFKLEGFHDDEIFAYFDYHLRNSVND